MSAPITQIARVTTAQTAFACPMTSLFLAKIIQSALKSMKRAEAAFIINAASTANALKIKMQLEGDAEASSARMIHSALTLS